MSSGGFTFSRNLVHYL